MVNEAAGDNSAEDREVIRLAKARLGRLCRMPGPKAEQALNQAAVEQKAALVAVALRVLAASPEDLIAGRVVRVGPPPGPRGHGQHGQGPKRFKPAHKSQQGKRWKGRKRY